jgi:hypothetical protein
MTETWEDSCSTYCSHGGVCTLSRGHDGLHDSRYCKWSDEEAISREEADEILSNKGSNGALVKTLWDLLIPE